MRASSLKNPKTEHHVGSGRETEHQKYGRKRRAEGKDMVRKALKSEVERNTYGHLVNLILLSLSDLMKNPPQQMLKR